MDIREQITKELFRRRYSPRTIETYIGCVERFFNWCRKEPREVTKKNVKEFLEKLSDKGSAGNTINVNLMALKFYFEQVLHRKMWIDIKYSKTPKRIQRYLTQEETRKLIDSIINFKHQLIVCIIYSAGLRVSELINLKVKDLVLDKCYGYVRNGKGGKDRLIVISKNLIPAIIKLVQTESLSDEDHLFKSNRGSKYSSKSIEKIIKNSAKKAKIKNWKEIHPHTLRHSFATHLTENDSDISTVQAMLGHKFPETTMIYVHSSSTNLLKTKSPLENL